MFCFKSSFLLRFFPLFSNVFTNILKIYELPKIQNRYLKILHSNHAPGQFYVTTSSGFWTLLNMYTWGQRTLLVLNQKKILGRIFFKKNIVPKESFFFLHQMLSLFSPINIVYVLDIKIFERDEIIQIWIIFSKDISVQYLCKISCRESGQYLTQFDALEKSVVRLQITAFINCNK